MAAYLAIWRALLAGRGPAGEAFNAGGGEPHRVGEVVALICRLAGSRVEPEIRGTAPRTGRSTASGSTPPSCGAHRLGAAGGPRGGPAPDDRVVPARTPPRIAGFQRAPATSDSSNAPAIPLSLEKKQTVGFFAGCIGSVMFDEVNRKAVELLSACGAEVVAPRAQVCCGAIHHHNGAHDPAQEMARRNIDTFLPINGPAVDAIVSTVAGCGAMLREYDLLLRGDRAYAERARCSPQRCAM